MALLNSLYNLERSIDFVKTQEVFFDCLNRLGLYCELHSSNNELEVSHSVIYNSKGDELSRGSGKGEFHTFGSKTEAVEHYVSEIPVKHEVSLLKDIAQQKPFKGDFFIQCLVHKNFEESIRVSIFNSFKDKIGYRVPSGYINPNIYNISDVQYENNITEAHLGKFSSNTGTALGLCIDDALVHGLNECIERQYESLFYQSIIGIRQDVKWYLYKAELKSLHVKKINLINKYFGKVITVFTKSFAGSFVSFSVLEKDNPFLMAQIGAGSSIFFELAIQRGIDELAQCLLHNVIYKEKLRGRNKYAFKLLKSHKKLWPLIDLSFSSIRPIIDRRGIREEEIQSLLLSSENIKLTVDFEMNRGEFCDSAPLCGAVASESKLSIKQQIDFMVNNLLKKGYSPLYRTLLSQHGVFVTQVFIPGFDRFYTIRDGNAVAPLSHYQNFNDIH